MLANEAKVRLVYFMIFFLKNYGLNFWKKTVSSLCQVMTNPCSGLSVIFCGFISHLIGRETINIPEIFSGVHIFTGNTVRM